MIFSERLRSCRIAKGLTQKEAGEAVGVKMRQWQEYEAGNKMPTFDRLIQIADCFMVSIDYLTGRSDNKRLLPEKETENNEELAPKRLAILQPSIGILQGKAFMLGIKEITKNFPNLQPHEKASLEQLQEHNILKEVFAKRLSELLEQKKISLLELGNYAGINYRWLKSLMNGESSPNFGLICAVADSLDVSFDYLIGDTDDSTEKITEIADMPSKYLGKRISHDIPFTPVSFTLYFLERKVASMKNSHEKENFEICLETTRLLNKINKRKK